MVLDAVSNFVRGTADAAVGTDDTTVSVADASIFPDPATDGEFNVVIWDVNNFPRPDQDGDVEIMRVTARDTTADELTVTRGQEMTSAASHPEGSAIHLSPTAKIFSDIEATFGDFWDAGAQELTADVNNTNTTTQALEADRVNTAPTGVAVKLDENQIVADDTVTTVEWMTEVESRGEVNNLLNEANNSIEIPSGYNFAQVSVALRFNRDPNLDIFRPRLNGGTALGWGVWLRGTTTGLERISRTTGFASVSEGDEITTEIRHQNESSVEIQQVGDTTAMVVWLL